MRWVLLLLYLTVWRLQHRVLRWNRAVTLSLGGGVGGPGRQRWLEFTRNERVQRVETLEVCREASMQVQLSRHQCITMRKLFKFEEESPKRTRRYNPWTSQRARNTLCSHQPEWKNLIIKGHRVDNAWKDIASVVGKTSPY